MHYFNIANTNQSTTFSSRTRFMIETLTSLKNNKLKRNATQNQGGDAVDRMKKFLSGLSKKRHGMCFCCTRHRNRLCICASVRAHEPLHVSLNDLRSAESKGKWWLVGGAAWAGDLLVDRQEEFKEMSYEEEVGNGVLLQLAKKQGMNTDIRRGIFVVLMSSDVRFLTSFKWHWLMQER
jgi:nucleolar MIF4G domain-containing protein 1